MSRTLTRKFSRSLWSLFSVFFLKMSLCPEYDTLLLTPLARWPTLSPPRGRGPGWGPSTSGALTPPWPPSSVWSPSSSSSSPSCAQSASTSSSGQTASGRRWEVEDEYCHLLSSVVRKKLWGSKLWTNVNNANKSTKAQSIELFRWILLKQKTDNFFPGDLI